MARLSELEAFVQTADLGSQSAAAEALGLSRMSVSRLIGNLEERLGVQLLLRTTRQQRLTDAGLRHLEDARVLIAQYKTFTTGEKPVLRSRLRVSAPVSFGVRRLMPIVARFSVAHPEIELDLMLNDRLVDLADEGFDLSIRISNHLDPKLETKLLARSKTLICGAPSYLAKAGTPLVPTHLSDHNCLRYAYSDHGRDWVLKDATQTYRVPVSGTVTANNGDALLAAAIAGMGLILQPDFVVADALADGSLRRVLEDYRTKSFAIQTNVMRSARPAAAIRAFIDFVAMECQARQF